MNLDYLNYIQKKYDKQKQDTTIPFYEDRVRRFNVAVKTIENLLEKYPENEVLKEHLDFNKIRADNSYILLDIEQRKLLKKILEQRRE
jgi:hypothetical protein